MAKKKRLPPRTGWSVKILPDIDPVRKKVRMTALREEAQHLLLCF